MLLSMYRRNASSSKIEQSRQQFIDDNSQAKEQSGGALNAKGVSAHGILKATS